MSPTPSPVRIVYTSESPLANPIRLIGEIASDVWRHRELTWILFLRDLKAQYRQSYLGYLWVFVPIIATTISWMYLNASGIVSVNTGKTPYPLFVITGSLIWNAFTTSVNQPMNSFNANKSVFMKLNVPVESFILSGFGHVVFNLVLQTVFLIPIFLFMRATPATTAFLFPIGILGAVVVGMSLGMALVPLGSLYTDVTRATSLALSFGMLLSPVVYPPPESGLASVVMKWNPLTPVVMATRDWMTTGEWGYVPAMLIVTACSVAILGCGTITLRIAMPRLVERMGM